jgi:hypothetical protein
MAAVEGGNGGSGGAGAAAAGGAGQPGGGELQQEALSLAQLIGAPIHALVDAEAQSAMATARFIRSVGFEAPESGAPGDLGALQMARFKRRRRLADDTEEDYEIEIPLLTLLPIPALQIREADLEYTVKIIQTEALPEQRRQLVQSLQLKDTLPIDPPATMRAAYTSDTTRAGRRSVDMLLKMKVRIEQADMPAGLARLLNLATESLNQRRLGPPPEPTPGSDGG